MACQGPEQDQAERPEGIRVPGTAPDAGSIAATGPERGRSEAAAPDRVTRTRGSAPRGPAPVSSARFPCPAADGGLAPEHVTGTSTITARARGRTPATGTKGTGTDPATGAVADLAGVPAVDTAPDLAAEDMGRGRVTPTVPMTTAVTRTATVTAMGRPPLSPSTCGRSSGRF
ncbi:hypothetical protein GCM10009540_06780 [Streptomyces turgidiscabies]